jgi:hypothetical protein
MSVFHRVDNLEAMRADRFVALMRRLPIYDGAVRHAAIEASEQVTHEIPEPAPALSAEQLQRMNSNALYGPMAGQQVGMFEVVQVPAA